MLLWLAMAVFAAALAYLVSGAILHLRQERIIFHPSKEMLCDPAVAGLPFERCLFESSDGVKLEGWLIPAGDKPLCTVLFCIGNAGNIANYLETACVFHSLGCELFLFNYRGYGGSAGGFPSEEGVYLDAEAAWDFLVKARGVPEGRIAIVGRSLGGAVACELAMRRDVRALVMESAFKSIPAIASELYPLYPASLLAKFKFDNLSKAARLKCPCLVVHSFEDELVPYRHGKALFKACSGMPKAFVALTGSHNACYFVSQASYTAALKGFLKANFQG